MSQIFLVLFAGWLAGIGGAAQHEVLGQAVPQTLALFGVDGNDDFGPERELKRASTDSGAITKLRTELAHG